MKFDTRDKKPYIWNIAVLALVTAILVSIFMILGSEKNALVILIIFDVFYFGVILLLIRAVLEQSKYNPYSYNTIYYIGFALFVISIFVTNVVLAVRLVSEAEMYSGQNFSKIIDGLNESARFYMLLSCPFVLAVSVSLCISNVALIRHEGFRFTNILGIILSAFLLGGEAFLFFGDDNVLVSEQYVMRHELFMNTFAAIYLYFECMVLGGMITNILIAQYKPRLDKDYIIILGCSIKKDGTPTPLLKGRIDKAIAFRNEQIEQTGKQPVFITSGGKGDDEVISESEAMKQYLIQKGIPESHILEENQSTSTLENMKFSKAKIDAHNPDAKILFSTTNYHVFRSGMIARRINMRAAGIGAKTKWYFWPNALVREFLGLLTSYRRKQAVIITSLIAFYAVMSYLSV